MARTATPKMPAPDKAMSRKAAIVGIGESNYHQDYKAARAKTPDYQPPTVEELSQLAFERALADSGLERRDIDALSVSFINGGPDAGTTASLLGLDPQLVINHTPIMAGPLPMVSALIASGECDTVAMVYSTAARAQNKQFGGNTYAGMTAAPSSYYYHLPWGWSSQAAHWAMIWARYQKVFGATEEDLSSVPIQLRNNAMTDPNAVMQTPISVEDYMASRYIVRPLHLLDICLVNDGAVCVIVRKADMARDLPHAPVLVAGWGESKVKNDKMHYMVRERLRPQLQDAGGQAFAMAGVGLPDVGHFEGYDAASIHLALQIEGYGFVEPGTALQHFKHGEMARGGRLPVNTNGGMLSAAYMHGWGHVAEITRQMRGEAGVRQIEGLDVSMFSMVQTDEAHPVIFTRGA